MAPTTTSVSFAATNGFAARNNYVTPTPAYALFLHRSEMKRKRMHIIKWSQSKIRLTDYLIIKQKQRMATCTNEDLQCMARGQDFRNFLHNQIVQRQMQQKVNAAAARNPHIVIGAPKPTSQQAPIVAAPIVAAPIVAPPIVAPPIVAAPIVAPPIVRAPNLSMIVPVFKPALSVMPPVAWSEPKIRTPACAVFMHRAELKRKRMHLFKISQTKIYLTDHLVYKFKQSNAYSTCEEIQFMLREMGFRNNLNGDLLNRYKNTMAMQRTVLQKKLKRLQ